MEEKTMDNVAENEIERMEDLGQALEESYAHMGNGEYDTDTLLAWEKISEDHSLRKKKKYLLYLVRIF